MHPDLCNHSYATYGVEPSFFFTTPTQAQDFVVGYDLPGLATPPFFPSFTTAAASGPRGQAPDGYIAWYDKNNEAFFGRVTCLVMNGTRAAIGAVGQDRFSDPGPQAGTVLETIENGILTSFDRRLGLTFPDCAHATFPGGHGAGVFTMHDATG